MLFINVVSNFPITDRYLTCIKISSDYCNLKFKKIYLRFISCTINCGENKSTSILFCDVIFFQFSPNRAKLVKKGYYKCSYRPHFQRSISVSSTIYPTQKLSFFNLPPIKLYVRLSFFNIKVHSNPTSYNRVRKIIRRKHGY